MTQAKRFVCIGTILTLALGAGLRASAQEQPFPTSLKLHPEAEPRPALKYKLLPPFTERTPGNAAVFYGKVTGEAGSYFADRMRDEELERWQVTPLAELAGQRIPLMNVGMIERAARCDTCDWQLPLRESSDPMGIPLPEVQQTRTFARIIAVKARLLVANGEFDTAVHALQTGYALGRHVAQGQTVVNSLVGLRHFSTMNRQVATFIQQPGAPNLYWALTNLPRPLVDPSDALEFERNMIEMSFPTLRDLESMTHRAEEWQDILYRLARQMAANGRSPQFSAAKFEEACRQLHPEAKRAMVERGLTRAQVNAMSMHQVILLSTIRTYHDLFDRGTKQFWTAYPEAIRGFDAAIEQAEQAKELIPIGLTTLKALRAARTTIARMEREIALLRIAEALRIYAASHPGQLPGSLDEIKTVPIPVDPATDAAFDYRVENEKATISGPPLSDTPLSLEISLARQ